jgi:hypothetical protein
VRDTFRHCQTCWRGTYKELGIEVPLSTLMRIDEVIE